MILCATDTPHALYTFPQTDEPYDILLLTPVVALATDARTFEPFVVPAIEPAAISAPSWVPKPEVIPARSFTEAAKLINARIANRIGADYDVKNWNSGWRSLYACHWCEESIAPVAEEENHYIWLSVHDAECAVRTFLSGIARPKSIPRQHTPFNRRRIVA